MEHENAGLLDRGEGLAAHLQRRIAVVGRELDLGEAEPVRQLFDAPRRDNLAVGLDHAVLPRLSIPEAAASLAHRGSIGYTRLSTQEPR